MMGNLETRGLNLIYKLALLQELDLGVTQPTLSPQISSLEDSLGVILFERGHR